MGDPATVNREAADVETEYATYQEKLAWELSGVVRWGGLAIAGLLLVAWLFAQQYQQLLIMGVWVLLVSIGAFICRFSIRRGRAKQGAWFLLLGILLGIALIPILIPVLLPAVLIGYILLLMQSYQMLGDRPGYAFTVICVAIFVANVLLPSVLENLLGNFPSLLDEIGLPLACGAGLTGLVGGSLQLNRIIKEQKSSFQEASSAQRQLKNQADLEKWRREQQQTMAEKYVEFMSRVARGDLVSRLVLDRQEDDGGDPFVTLGRNLNDTVVSLQTMSLQLRDVATSLTTATAEIQASIFQQSQSTSEQSSALLQTTSTIGEVRAIAGQTAERARSVADLARRTAEVSEAGQKAALLSIEGMNSVKQKVEIIARNILALSEQAQAIGQITASVNEIANQSSMLALNAAVEAARAGEAGQGFAVVAGEVRTLADQSRAATRQVGEILSEIQRGVNTAVMATEEGMKGADVGVRLTEQAGDALRRLAENVIESAQAAQQITAAAGQQLAGMEQIALSMQSIDQATAQSMAGAHQTTNAAERLSELARQLREQVEQYQL